MKSFEKEEEKKKIKLSKCPKCGRIVPPIKRPSVSGMWFLSWIYLIYYYELKKPECPYCGYSFSKKEMLEEE